MYVIYFQPYIYIYTPPVMQNETSKVSFTQKTTQEFIDQQQRKKLMFVTIVDKYEKKKKKRICPLIGTYITQKNTRIYADIDR